MKREIIVLLLASVLVGCSKRIYDMPSSSMEPTILAGSKVTIDYAAYKSEPPARFDIVAFRPLVPPNAIFTFRVIGLPGEEIQISPEVVLVDGKEITPPNGLRYTPVSSGINQTNLGTSAYFLLGDNTASAKDSRYFGPIDGRNILGKVVRIEQRK